MFVKTLIPTDFSPDAAAAVSCIGQVPGIVEAVLLHVLVLPREKGTPGWEPALEETRIDEARRMLEEERQVLASSGTRTRTLLKVIRRGSVASAILSVAAGEQASLIAMGARGLGPVRRMILGSVSEEVLRESRVHVLLMQAPRGEGLQPEGRYCRFLFSALLCPLDFSKPSREMVEVLRELPAARQVVLLHVIRSGVTPLSTDDGEGTVRDALDGLAAVARAAGIAVQPVIRRGDPVRQILSCAHEQDASLILIPRYGVKDYMKNIAIGSTARAVAMGAHVPVLVRFPQVHLEITAHELTPEEFPLAEAVWKYYHGQKGDPATDRIFGVWVEGQLAAVARCRRHPDGHEVDAVFTPEEYRNRGYARRAMRVLIEAVGDRTLYMHSVAGLEPFYRTFGFDVIPEEELPRTIRERYNYAMGDLAEAHITPMRRIPPGTTPT